MKITARKSWVAVHCCIKRVRTARASREAGFTLIELLVALSLLALLLVAIPSTIRLASRAALTSAALIEGSQTGLSMSFIEDRLAEAMPLLEADDEGTLRIAFTGAPDRLSFVAPLANGPSGGGLYLLDLSVAASEQNIALKLRVANAGRKTPSAESSPREERILLNGLASASFRYFGVPQGKQRPEWSPNWTRIDRLPNFVELILTPTGDEAPTQTHIMELKLRHRL